MEPRLEEHCALLPNKVCNSMDELVIVHSLFHVNSHIFRYPVSQIPTEERKPRERVS